MDRNSNSYIALCFKQVREKWGFFVNSTTGNMPYVHPRLDSIPELCQSFPNFAVCDIVVYPEHTHLPFGLLED